MVGLTLTDRKFLEIGKRKRQEPENNLLERIRPMDKQLVKDYFNKADLKGFEKINDGFLRLISQKRDRGYVFSFDVDEGHKRRMLDEKIFYEEKLNRNIVRYFVDNQEKLSGFYWEKK